MTSWKSVRIGVAAAAIGIMVTGSVMALGVNHENRLTFNRPVALPGVVLPAGTYSFDVADAAMALDVVVVRNKTRTKVFYMGFTNQVRRPAGMSPNIQVTVGEAAANEATPITTWYEIGHEMGHEFRY